LPCAGRRKSKVELVVRDRRVARMPYKRRSRPRMTCTIPPDRRWRRDCAGEKVGDVLRPNRVFGETPREGRSERVLPIGREQPMESIDIADPDARPSMRELGEVLQRGPTERQQMLPLQIPLGALAGDGGDVFGAMLREGRRGAALEHAA